LTAETGLFKLFFLCLVLLSLATCKPARTGEYILTGKTVYVLVAGDTIVEKPALPADTSYLEYVFSSYDLVDIRTLDSSVQVSLRYADTSNFTHVNLYDGLRKAYMTCDLAIKLCNAQHHLKRHDSTLSLLVLDAARPLHIQQFMWDSLNLDREFKRKYLTPPEMASLHNYGCALDVTLVDSAACPLKMGTEFDAFGRLSEPRFEQEFLASGQLDSVEVKNRKLLRHVMATAGLKGIVTEWWHFSLCSRQEATERFKLIR
jgi:D-alanyl-D-alanine dipeptidase